MHNLVCFAYFLSIAGSLAVSAIAINYIERVVSAVIYYVLNGTLKELPHSSYVHCVRKKVDSEINCYNSTKTVRFV